MFYDLVDCGALRLTSRRTTQRRAQCFLMNVRADERTQLLHCSFHFYKKGVLLSRFDIQQDCAKALLQ